MNKKYLVLAVLCVLATLYGVYQIVTRGFGIGVIVPTLAFAAVAYYFITNIRNQK